MLYVCIIQDLNTGIKLIEYRQENTQFETNHLDIFSGCLSAIKSISIELDIGNLVLISTEGTKGHNCIIAHHPPIDVILLVDMEDPVDLWKEQGRYIATEFMEKYGKDYKPSRVSAFNDFKDVIKEMCAGHNYCD